jgi:hypothetical protein
MASFDLIMSSLKLAWSEGAYTALVPANSIYFDRAQKPNQMAGFPFVEVFIKEDSPEVVTEVETYNSLCTYHVEIDVYTCQGMTGGTSTGDQLTDQGNIQRALEAILNYLPPNTPWNNVVGFLHCIKGETTIGKDAELYRMDVIISKQHWTLLISE